MVFGAVRQWSPEDWPVPSHCAQGLGPSPYHALQFVGARDLVSPTFGFLLLRLAFFPRICCLITLTRSWKASSTLRGGSLALVSIYGILCLVAISFPCSLVIFLKCIRSTLLATRIIGNDSLGKKGTAPRELPLVKAGHLCLRPDRAHSTSLWA